MGKRQPSPLTQPALAPRSAEGHALQGTHCFILELKSQPSPGVSLEPNSVWGCHPLFTWLCRVATVLVSGHVPGRETGCEGSVQDAAAPGDVWGADCSGLQAGLCLLSRQPQSLGESTFLFSCGAVRGALPFRDCWGDLRCMLLTSHDWPGVDMKYVFLWTPSFLACMVSGGKIQHLGLIAVPLSCLHFPFCSCWPLLEPQ